MVQVWGLNAEIIYVYNEIVESSFTIILTSIPNFPVFTYERCQLLSVVPW